MLILYTSTSSKAHDFMSNTRGRNFVHKISILPMNLVSVLNSPSTNLSCRSNCGAFKSLFIPPCIPSLVSMRTLNFPPPQQLIWQIFLACIVTHSMYTLAYVHIRINTLSSNYMALNFFFLILVVGACLGQNAPSPGYYPSSRFSTVGFDQGFRNLWSPQHQRQDQGTLTIWLDRISGLTHSYIYLKLSALLSRWGYSLCRYSSKNADLINNRQLTISSSLTEFVGSEFF